MHGFFKYCSLIDYKRAINCMCTVFLGTTPDASSSADSAAAVAQIRGPSNLRSAKYTFGAELNAPENPRLRLRTGHSASRRPVQN